jgi:H-NS histone family
MATFEKVQAQIEKLQAQAESLGAKQSSGVIATIREMMEKHGLTIADIDAHPTLRSGVVARCTQKPLPRHLRQSRNFATQRAVPPGLTMAARLRGSPARGTVTNI